MSQSGCCYAQLVYLEQLSLCASADVSTIKPHKNSVVMVTQELGKHRFGCICTLRAKCEWEGSGCGGERSEVAALFVETAESANCVWAERNAI